jgi:hypothetical protein
MKRTQRIDGTNAAFEITGLRQAPLAALQWSYIICSYARKGIVRSPFR